MLPVRWFANLENFLFSFFQPFITKLHVTSQEFVALSIINNNCATSCRLVRLYILLSSNSNSNPYALLLPTEPCNLFLFSLSNNREFSNSYQIIKWFIKSAVKWISTSKKKTLNGSALMCCCYNNTFNGHNNWHEDGEHLWQKTVIFVICLLRHTIILISKNNGSL